MDWKNLHGYVEVSPFMLFESTGDSEQPHSHHLTNPSFDDDDDDNVEVTAYDEVDDALSCCSDSSEIGTAYENDQFTDRIDRKRVRHDHDYDFSCRDQNDYDEDEDDDAIDQECTSGNGGFGYLRRQKKCKVVYGDCKMEPMKQQETDKLFWDTCLAS